jgi:toxin ParE1/3/4
MNDYVILPRARADLKEIWSFTADRWNSEQADRYVRELHRAIEAIARDPRKGRPCDHIRHGYRRSSAGAHVVFFRVVTQGIEVVRVLHQRMDFARHLK